MPVTSFAPAPAIQIPYVTKDVLFRLIAPNLDSFEILDLFTMKSCLAYKTFSPTIFSLWQQQAAANN